MQLIKYMISLLDGSIDRTAPVQYGTVDVRDVARAHVVATDLDLNTPLHTGRRFIASSREGPLDVARLHDLCRIRVLCDPDDRCRT